MSKEQTKYVDIIVNGRTVNVEYGSISYEDLCTLAGKSPESKPTISCSSKHRQGHTLCTGDIGPAEANTIYNVCNTNNA